MIQLWIRDANNDRVLKQVAELSDVVINGFQMESLSNVNISGAGLTYGVDARGSTYQGVSTGGANGRHRWIITGNKNTVDVLAGGSNITMIPNNNVSIVGNNFVKSITGNSWNSSGYSQESFDPNVEDFGFSWEVESITGTIREMGGLDNNPTQNNSFNSIEHAIYQVNGNFYSRVYENGAAVVHGIDVPLVVGDRLGIRVESGVVTYFIQKGAIIQDVYVSTKTLTVPVFFKAALNRGSSSSGASSLGNIQYHTVPKLDTFNVFFEGAAIDLITDEDKLKLKQEAGLDLQNGSTYSYWQFTRDNIDRFNGASSHPIDINHSYIGLYNSTQNTITF